MLTRPDVKTYTALARLAVSPEGVELLGLLDTELKRQMEILLEGHGDNLLRVQGRATQLKDLIAMLRGAREVAEKAR